jgi:hypothetical protein
VTAGASDGEGFARIALSFVAEPGDPVLGALVRACGAAEAFAVICDGRPQQPAGASGGRRYPPARSRDRAVGGAAWRGPYGIQARRLGARGHPSPVPW